MSDDEVYYNDSSNVSEDTTRYTTLFFVLSTLIICILSVVYAFKASDSGVTNGFDGTFSSVRAKKGSFNSMTVGYDPNISSDSTVMKVMGPVMNVTGHITIDELSIDGTTFPTDLPNLDGEKTLIFEDKKWVIKTIDVDLVDVNFDVATTVEVVNIENSAGDGISLKRDVDNPLHSGIMTADEKKKLDSLEEGAQKSTPTHLSISSQTSDSIVIESSTGNNVTLGGVTPSTNVGWVTSNEQSKINSISKGANANVKNDIIVSDINPISITIAVGNADSHTDLVLTSATPSYAGLVTSVDHNKLHKFALPSTTAIIRWNGGSKPTPGSSTGGNNQSVRFTNIGNNNVFLEYKYTQTDAGSPGSMGLGGDSYICYLPTGINFEDSRYEGTDANKAMGYGLGYGSIISEMSDAVITGLSLKMVPFTSDTFRLVTIHPLLGSPIFVSRHSPWSFESTKVSFNLSAEVTTSAGL